MNLPDNLRYSKEHEWIKEENGLFIVGVTDFAQKELGEIVFVEIETEGEKLSENTVFGTVEAVKTVSDLFMPVSGKIVEVNIMLADTPELVNQSPYEDGWMIKIKPENKDDIEKLMTAEAYKELIS